MLVRLVFVLIVLASLAVTPIRGEAVLDQSAPAGTANLGMGDSTSMWQQEVIAGITGKLVGFDLYSVNPDGLFFGSIEMYINLGSPWQFDAPEFSTVVGGGIPDGFFFVDTSAANIMLTAGQSFVIGATGRDDDSGGFFSLGGSSGAYLAGDPYSFAFGDAILRSEVDLGFNTYVDPAGAVPGPATLWLLGAGLAGLGAMSWRRARRA